MLYFHPLASQALIYIICYFLLHIAPPQILLKRGIYTTYFHQNAPYVEYCGLHLESFSWACPLLEHTLGYGTSGSHPHGSQILVLCFRAPPSLFSLIVGRFLKQLKFPNLLYECQSHFHCKEQWFPLSQNNINFQPLKLLTQLCGYGEQMVESRARSTAWSVCNYFCIPRVT